MRSPPCAAAAGRERPGHPAPPPRGTQPLCAATAAGSEGPGPRAPPPPGGRAPGPARLRRQEGGLRVPRASASGREGSDPARRRCREGGLRPRAPQPMAREGGSTGSGLSRTDLGCPARIWAGEGERRPRAPDLASAAHG
ncbi:hypothetical protein PVAP13_1NG201457 [Panicum virgatum]|uniref:Uncharacterized protein n=1 Tax=Panicum virgatum TaxID=38727 RepID=A0A8T0WNM0_PANVG|nr:hypothetical protein PVAP13_1NG201457 [Panicum virgatum]